jgi:hypothetical protein
MLSHDDIPELDLRLKQLRIITGALIAGVFFFGIVVVATGSLNQPPNGQTVSLMGAAGAAIQFVLYLIVPSVIARKAGGFSSDPKSTTSLLNIYQTKHVIGLALLEGAAFFNLVCCMVEHNLWSAGIVIALVLIMLGSWPTQTRMLQWIETQQMSGDFR